MITRVFTTDDFINVTIACVDATGAAADPSAATAKFYLISVVDGTLSLDTRLATNGVATLVKQHSITGFYGAAIDIAPLPAGQWVVLFQATIGGIDTIATDYLAVDPDPRISRVAACALYDAAADSLLVTAWLTMHGELVAVPLYCTVTVFDETGTQVGDPLEEDVPDARGVFRVTMADAGLTLGTGYYATVELESVSGLYTDVVPIIDVQEALAITTVPANVQEIADNAISAAAIAAAAVTKIQAGLDTRESSLPTSRIYHVASWGSDLNDGHSAENAVLTLQKLFNASDGLAYVAAAGPLDVFVHSDIVADTESAGFVIRRLNAGHTRLIGVNRPIVSAGYTGHCSLTVVAVDTEIAKLQISHHYGNGIDLNASRCWVHHNWFTGTCDSGSDIHVGYTSAITDCLIEDNFMTPATPAYAKGIMIGYSSAQATRIVVRRNLVLDRYAGIWFCNATKCYSEGNRIQAAISGGTDIIFGNASPAYTPTYCYSCDDRRLDGGTPSSSTALAGVGCGVWNIPTDLDALPAVAPNASGGLMTFGTGAGQINPDGTGQVPSSNAYTGTPPTVEQIQSGLATGGNVTAATAAIAALFEVIKGTGWDVDTDTLEKIAAAIAGVGGAVGPGASPTTIEWLDADSGLPVADGDVWVSTDAAGANVIAGTLQTNSLGKATFMLDTGVTYYLWGQKDGYAPIEGESFVAE